MKKLLILLLPAIIATGCNDDSDNVSCQLTSIVFNNTDTAQIVYNDQGKVIKYGDLNSAHYTFSYSGLTATVMFGPKTTSLFLNGDGHVVSFSDTITVGLTVYYYDYSFEYDANGHLVKSVQSVADNALGLNNATYKDSMVYESGNLVEKYTFYKGPAAGSFTLEDRAEIEYGSTDNKLGLYFWSTDEEPLSISTGWLQLYHLFGASSKDLPVRTKVYNNGGTLITQRDYSFLMNSDGFPSEVNIIRSVSASSTENRKFFYDCD